MNNPSSPALRTTTEPAVQTPYHVGDKDDRPWGHYIVTGVGTDANGEEFCEKIIVVKPWQALSLQSHDQRREIWLVKEGILTALVDDRLVTATPGQSVYISQGSIHCMANLTDEDCVVEERQIGVCREDDIRRYMDAYNRATETLSGMAAASAALYKDILGKISKTGEKRN